MTALIAVGFWSDEAHPEWPDPNTFVATEWDRLERARIAEYLLSATSVIEWRGFSFCRICGKQNGYRDYSDGTYFWPEGYGHYVVEHDVRPPQDFIQHAVERVRELKAAQPDFEWWLREARSIAGQGDLDRADG